MITPAHMAVEKRSAARSPLNLNLVRSIALL
jgi:hypothetical protein